MTVTNPLSRRDFLKLGLTGAGAALFSSPLIRLPAGAKLANIMVLLFDSWSAKNLPIHGYGRDTMPFLTKLAERAVVYHNHYSGANFTTPGTASLLTGTPPHVHRAFSGNSKVIKPLKKQNIFRTFRNEGYETIAYTHNTYANTLLRQFSAHISTLIPSRQLFLDQSPLRQLLGQDLDTVILSKNQILLDTPAASLILSKIYTLIHANRVDRLLKEYLELFPGGLPSIDGTEFYNLEKGIDYLSENMAGFKRPFFAYFHFLPPHGPYNTRREFYQTYQDAQPAVPAKPEHPLSEGFRLEEMRQIRQDYDAYLLYVDSEFNRLYQSLSAQGVLDDTLLVLTSDHGEMFERGIVRHGKATLHEPVIRIPLMLFHPGFDQRIDVYQRTTAMDVYPTLSALAGLPHPESSTGKVMPPFGMQASNPDEAFIITHAEGTQRFQPLTFGSWTIFKGDLKLSRYSGYPMMPEGETLHEMYDIKADPEELVDLASSEAGRAGELINELVETVENSNRPYRS